MKNIIRKAISLITILIFCASPVGAVSTATLSSGTQSSGLFFGQKHSYTVIFRGNGEAITYAKITFTNPSEDTDMSELSFNIPKVSPSEMAIFQMKLPESCRDYDYINGDSVCVKYSEADYDQDYYYSYSNDDAEYQKVKFSEKDGDYKLALPAPVKPYKSSAIIVAYAAKGYVSDSLGLFKFNFETIKVDSRITSVTVAVDVDSDLILKGKNSSVNYATSTKNTETLMAASDSFSSGRLDSIVGSIGSYTQLTKTAKNLSRNESFNVRGEYSTNWFRLYLSSIVWSVLIIAGIIVGLFFLTKILKKRSQHKKALKALLEPTLEQEATASVKSVTVTDANLNLTSVAIYGMVSTVLVGIVWAIVSAIGSSNILYQLGGSSLSAVFIIIALLLSILAAFGPAVNLCVKRGWKYLIPVICAEVLWIIVFAILYAIVFNSGLNTIFRYRTYVD